MKLRMFLGTTVLFAATALPLALAVAPQVLSAPPQEDIKLPSGKSQRDEILKSEHEQNIKDAAHLVELAEELKSDIEKHDRFVLSMGTLKKTDEIEKLVKKIRSRLRH